MEHRVPSGVPPTALGEYLPRALPETPQWALRQMLAQRQVKRDGLRLCASDRVGAGDVLRIYLPRAAFTLDAKSGDARYTPAIVYEDARILVVNKPQGISSQGKDDPRDRPGLLEHLRARAMAQGENPAALQLCHRLDVQTGGLLLLAKTPLIYATLLEAFAQHAIEKIYTCITVGTPQPREAFAQAYLRKNAHSARVSVHATPVPGALPIQTGYRVLQEGTLALLSVSLITGRTHQIRAHFAFIGYPILGDDRYGDRAANRRYGARAQRLWATGLTLHAGGLLSDLDGHALTVPFPFVLPPN